VRGQARQEVAEHGLGAAIHRRAVEHLAAGIAQPADHLGQRREFRAVGADVEAHIGATADDRQRFAARWDRTHLHGCSFIAGLRAGESISEQGGAQAGGHAGGKPQEARTRQASGGQALQS